MSINIKLNTWSSLGQDEEQWKGVNVERSMEQLCSQIEDAVREDYPDAEITVDWEDSRVTGNANGADIRVGHMDDQDVAHDVFDAVQVIWGRRNDWVVFA